eukprot:CAMPEP_0172206868 /NCGR_PEP_ID=MMETSP1050-20130122/33484_1 /TAXON_ID=233186 /ORGANISM="Cryptomonas curvata, Strain CCAP979/52" /LENGTH=98 /DNA_ID=CAMNT_0012886053 /DNA_START=1 /DNA_END=294 /DNA_ORIENTATION=+
MFCRFSVGDLVQGRYVDGVWYRCEILEVQKSKVLVDFGSGDEEWISEKSWRTSLLNRTIHLNGLPNGWTGKFVIREVADERGQPQPLGDWKFMERKRG